MPARGRTYDELALGDSFTSPGRTVTETDIVQFAGLSGDYNPLHTDREFASRTPFRGVVAHGMLVQAISTGLANRIGVFDGTVAALAGMELHFKAPVRAGDTVRITLEVIEKEPEAGPRRAWVRFATEVLNQADEVVIDGAWQAVMLRRR